MQLLQVLRAAVPFPALSHAWTLIERGVERRMLLEEDLSELVDHLARGRDFMVDELGFEFVDGVLTVALLDQEAECDPGLLVDALRAAEAAVRGTR